MRTFAPLLFASLLIAATFPVGASDGRSAIVVDGPGAVSYGISLALDVPTPIRISLELRGGWTGSVVGFGATELFPGEPAATTMYATVPLDQTHYAFPYVSVHGTNLPVTSAACLREYWTCTLVVESSLVHAREVSFVVWGGGRSASTLRIEAPGASIETTTGTAHVLSDADLAAMGAGADPRLSIQGAPVAGARAYTTSATIGVTQQSHGAFYSFDGTRYTLGDEFAVAGEVLLASPHTTDESVVRPIVNEVCRGFVGVECETTQMSWVGPTGGGSGSRFYDMEGRPVGAYAFNVDLKADAYTSAWLGHATTGSSYTYQEDPFDDAGGVTTPIWAELPDSIVVLSLADVVPP